MRKIVRLLFVLVVFSAAFAFAENERLTVAVSLQPYATLVKMIGGERVNVVTMLPPGADPHNYEPKPAVIKAFSLAQIYFTDSSGLDKVWLPRFLSANKKVQIKNISKNIDWIEMDEKHHGHKKLDMHHDHDIDPHLWTSPTRVKTLGKNIFDALKQLDPEHVIYYVNQYARVYDMLTEVERQLNQAVIYLPSKNRSFIVFHPAYGYFAKDFKLQQYTIEVNGKEPKPRDLAKLIKIGKKNNIKVVFVQPQFSKRSAETIAKALGAVIVETDPLSADFIGNTKKIIEALSKVKKNNVGY